MTSTNPILFLSHASKDKIYLEKSIERIRHYHMGYWTSEEYINPDTKNVYKKLRKAVKNCNIFILFWSNNSANSMFVRDEINWITDPDNNVKKRYVLKIFDKDGFCPELPPHLEDPFIFSVSNMNDLQNHIDTIVKDIRLQIG